MFLIRITFIRYKGCQWLVTRRWFSPGTPVSSTNKNNRHNIAEILLKVALNTTTLTLHQLKVKRLENLIIQKIYWRKLQMDNFYTYPAPPEGGGRVYFFTSVHPKIFFVAFLSATIDGRNLISGHKLHIGMPYCGKRFWTRQIPTSCLPT